MSYVENRIRTFDSQVWCEIEKLAISHPQTSRLCAIPVAIGTLVRDTLATPARCAEEVVLTLKSISELRIDSHILHAVKYAILTPFSPLVGIVDAIVSFVKVALSPLKTAKINATKQDFEFFLEHCNFGDTEGYRNKIIYARAVFNRFENRVSSAPSREAVMSLHFLENEASKERLITEINLKQTKWREANLIMRGIERQINRRIFDNGFFQSFLTSIKLDKTWENFCKELIVADPTPVDTQLNQPPYIFQFEV
jgi:hypothetical protein